jgi:F0F1-type ATP synthase assembly protein I
LTGSNAPKRVGNSELEMLNSVARQAVRILGWQMTGLIVLTAVAATLYGGRVGRSVLIGAGIGLIATSYLVFVLIKHSLRPARPATVLSLFGNWFIKMGLVLGLLAIALRADSLLPPAVLTGLAGSMLTYWLTMLVKR